ncbi:MAG TPA: MarR family transcriptional regulator [Aeromicrobium sp.]|nr:MarR family transcriptional regulator [Aeromicrobium sp.]HKY57774.1 MarR family transcriptional regulator [Aeromicrobium sp.]
MTKATRDALTREILELNERIRLQCFELAGPMAFPPDLTMRQLHVLVAASQSEGVTVHELANALGTSAPTASGLVNRLAAKGLVTRVEDDVDRRVRHVQLTEKGQETLNVLDSTYEHLLGEMVNLLDADELSMFRDNSRMMLDMVERTREHRCGRQKPA